MSLSNCVNTGFLALENKLGSFSMFFMFAFYGDESSTFFGFTFFIATKPCEIWCGKRNLYLSYVQLITQEFLSPC